MVNRNAEAKFRLTGQIKSGKEVTAYRVLDETTFNTVIASVEEVKQMALGGQLVNAALNAKRELVGTQGALSRLPVFVPDGALVSGPRVTILGVETSNKGNKKYMLMDAYGRVSIADTNQTIAVIKSNESTNAKLVNKDGKTIISAIMGEFKVIRKDTKESNKIKKDVQDNTVVKEVPENKIKWERSYSDARYLGKTKPTDSSRLYEKVLMCRRLRRKLKETELTGYNVVHTSYGINSNIRKLLEAVSAGKVGKRMKKHYEYTLKLLKDSGSMGKEASEIMNIKRTLENNRGVASKKDADKYLKFVETFCIDCLNYNRVVLSKEHLKDLIKYITSSKDAMEYIEDNANMKGQGKDLIDAIKISSKSKIDSISSVMFICALEIIAVPKIQNRASIEKIRRKKVNRIVGRIAYMLKEEPVKIDSESDYGSMIFQALIIAMALK